MAACRFSCEASVFFSPPGGGVGGLPEVSVDFSPSQTHCQPYPSPDMGHLTPPLSSSSSCSEGSPPTKEKPKKRSGKSTYKHIPHREKAPHLVQRRNARERRRVQAVNSAFLRLRRHVPHENRHKRLSKVKTLHHAIEYINYLQALISDYDSHVALSRGQHHHQTLDCGVTRNPHINHLHHHNHNHPLDMVELTNSSKENRWMPINMGPIGGGHQNHVPCGRELYLPDAYSQYHQT